MKGNNYTPSPQDGIQEIQDKLDLLADDFLHTEVEITKTTENCIGTVLAKKGSIHKVIGVSMHLGCVPVLKLDNEKLVTTDSVIPHSK